MVVGDALETLVEVVAGGGGAPNTVSIPVNLITISPEFVVKGANKSVSYLTFKKVVSPAGSSYMLTAELRETA
jgi:hypothetical protein